MAGRQWPPTFQVTGRTSIGKASPLLCLRHGAHRRLHGVARRAAPRFLTYTLSDVLVTFVQHGDATGARVEHVRSRSAGPGRLPAADGRRQPRQPPFSFDVAKNT